MADPVPAAAAAAAAAALGDPVDSAGPRVIQAGEWLVLHMGDGRHFFAQAAAKGTLRLGKTNVAVSGLLGHKYGTVFEVQGKQLVPTQYAELYEDIVVEELDAADDNTASVDGGHEAAVGAGGPPLPSVTDYDGSAADNRGYSDTNTAQKLTQEDLAALKAEGKTGQAIIQALAQNSETWEKKTIFAKQKWAKKKAQKYVVRIRAIAASASTIAEAMFHKQALVRGGSVGGSIRPDSLAQLLAYGNAHAGCTALVLDGFSGLLLGAVLERMGGHGHALHVYPGQQPHLQHLKYYNLARTQQQSPHLVSLSALEMGPKLLAARAAACVEGSDVGEAVVEEDMGAVEARWEAEEAAAEAREKAAARAAGSFDDKDTGMFSELRWERYMEKRRPRRRQLKLARHLLVGGADCLVAAFKHHDPCQAVGGLLPYLREGAAFAVFCEYLEPLVELQARLVQMGMLRLQLLSTWWREMQILPGRSHPSMNMSADGGFLLTGIKITRSTEEEEVDIVAPGGEEGEGDGEEAGGKRGRGGRGGRGGWKGRGGGGDGGRGGNKRQRR